MSKQLHKEELLQVQGTNMKYYEGNNDNEIYVYTKTIYNTRRVKFQYHKLQTSLIINDVYKAITSLISELKSNDKNVTSVFCVDMSEYDTKERYSLPIYNGDFSSTPEIKNLIRNELLCHGEYYTDKHGFKYIFDMVICKNGATMYNCTILKPSVIKYSTTSYIDRMRVNNKKKYNAVEYIIVTDKVFFEMKDVVKRVLLVSKGRYN